MGIPLARLRNEVDEKDLMIYQAYDRLEPFGYQRQDISNAIICQTLAKVHGVKGTKLSDFIIDYENPVKKKTPQEMFALMSLALGKNAKKAVQ